MRKQAQRGKDPTSQLHGRTVVGLRDQARLEDAHAEQDDVVRVSGDRSWTTPNGDTNHSRGRCETRREKACETFCKL